MTIVNALIARGFDSETAHRLKQDGYTLNSLKNLKENELLSLNIREELIERILGEKRPNS